MKFKITEEEVALIEKAINERGNQSVLIRIEHGKLTIFTIHPKMVFKK